MGGVERVERAIERVERSGLLELFVAFWAVCASHRDRTRGTHTRRGLACEHAAVLCLQAGMHAEWSEGVRVRRTFLPLPMFPSPSPPLLLPMPQVPPSMSLPPLPML